MKIWSIDNNQQRNVLIIFEAERWHMGVLFCQITVLSLICGVPRAQIDLWKYWYHGDLNILAFPIHAYIILHGLIFDMYRERLATHNKIE